jgi:hypothetical protein
MLDQRLAQARALEQDVHPEVRRWSRRAVDALEAWRRRETREDREPWIWDHRMSRGDLEGLLEQPDTPERLWAIARLLEDAPEERVRQLLTPEDVLDALPKLPHLDRRAREKWETWARYQSAAQRRG